MNDAYDFSSGQRGAVVDTRGKTRITIFLDDEVLEAFRERAAQSGKGYQTLINEALRSHLSVAEQTLTAEVAQHIGDRVIRAIVMRLGPSARRSSAIARAFAGPSGICWTALPRSTSCAAAVVGASVMNTPASRWPLSSSYSMPTPWP